MNLRVVTWNLFHGRDRPPDDKLFTTRSRIFRITEKDGEFAQVNRPLKKEFVDAIERLEWDIAFLQEAPPTWHDDFPSPAAIALTSRNSFGRLRALAARLNTDLIASAEGGSNQLLARSPWRVTETRTHVIAMKPERRVMLWARVEGDGGTRVAVANMHGSVDTVTGAREQVLAAAGQAVGWAGDLPLVFGGDLNLRLSRQPDLFDALARRFDLAPPTNDRTAIDHLLVRGLDVVEPAHKLADDVRRVRRPDGLQLQLSDHAVVATTVSMR